MTDQDLVGATTPDPFPGMPIVEVIAFCRLNGIRKLSYRGVEIEFAPSAAAPEAPPTADALQKFSEALQGAVPSDLELLGWSAGGDFAGDIAQVQKILNGDEP